MDWLKEQWNEIKSFFKKITQSSEKVKDSVQIIGPQRIIGPSLPPSANATITFSETDRQKQYDAEVKAPLPPSKQLVMAEAENHETEMVNYYNLSKLGVETPSFSTDGHGNVLNKDDAKPADSGEKPHF